MASRYQELYRLAPRLYSDGSPVLIEAGALQKDTQTNKVLAQLKIKNVSKKNIIACKISIRAFESGGKELAGIESFSYLDLNAVPGSDFGTKIPVYLPNYTTRSFAPLVTEVVFSDNSVWSVESSEWTPLPEQKTLSDMLGDAELMKQVKLELGEEAKFYPVLTRGLFLCTCGEVSPESADKCCRCGRQYGTLIKQLDIEELNARKNARLQREQEEREAAAKAAEEERIRQKEKKEEKRKKTKKSLITIAVACVALVLLWFKVISPAISYSRAGKLRDAGDYDAAVAAFTELGDYKDSSGQIEETKYQKACSLLDAEDYDAAVTAFTELGEYKDSTSQLQKAYAAPLKNAKVGSSVFFGSYKNKDIQWRVLAKENGKLLLITDEAIEERMYNKQKKDITWEKCTLRSWLNDEFYNSAFSAGEKAMIQTTAVSADKKPEYRTNPGNATTDKVFLLSIQEAGKYFKTDKDRVCNYNGKSCWWWLRSPGDGQGDAARVISDGSVDYIGRSVTDGYRAVRPALWINPDS